MTKLEKIEKLVKVGMMSLVDDGQNIRVAKGNALKSSDIEFIKKNKPAFLEYLNKKAEEKKAEFLARRQARKDYEEKAEKMRVLVAFGGYLLNNEITTVVLIEDQSQFSDWLKGKAVMGLIDDPDPIAIDKKKSPTALKIMETPASGYQYGHGESAMWLISENDEAAILAEMKEFDEIKTNEKACNEKKDAEKFNEALTIAKKTGKKQALDVWVTDHCHNGSVECSFDQATSWVGPDGKISTTYSCCH
jgi:hypothetical protein